MDGPRGRDVDDGLANQKSLASRPFVNSIFVSDRKVAMHYCYANCLEMGAEPSASAR